MKISVIVPVYKVENYINECLNSILNQTYENFELILVDDGSPDNCPKILDEYAEKDSRVKVIHKENGGASVARNVALDIATGDYVYFVDSDDFIEETTLETLVNALNEEEVDALGFNFYKEFENSFELQKNELFEEKVYKGEDYNAIYYRSIGLVNNELNHFTKTNAFAVIWSKLYSKKIIDEYNIRFNDIKKLGSFEDGLFNIEFFSHAKSFRYIDKALYHYRKTNAQSVATNYKADFYNKQKNQILIMNSLVGDDNELALQAVNNRIAYMLMEYCINALESKNSYKEKRSELKLAFNDDEYKKALKSLSIKKLPTVFKAYYLVLKSKCIFGVYLITKIILRLRKGR